MPHDHDRHRRRRHSRDPDHDRDPARRHRKHRPAESGSELLPKHGRARDSQNGYYPGTESASASPSPRKTRHSRYDDFSAAGSGNPLSAGALAALEKSNEKRGWSGQQYDQEYLEQVRERELRMERERRREEKRERRAERDARRQSRAEAERAAIAAAEAEREAARIRSMEREKRRRKEEEQASEGLYEEYEYGSGTEDKVRVYRDEKHRKRRYTDSEREDRRRRRRHDRHDDRRHGKDARVVSGQVLEKGGYDTHDHRLRHRGGAARSDSSDGLEPWWKRKKKLLIIVGLILALVIIIAIVVGVVVSRNQSGEVESQAAENAPKPANSNLKGASQDDYPKGTYYDPFSWYDTEDFNITLTEETVGGLPIMGLNSTWNDKVQCNSRVPPLTDTFDYGKMPIRGINIGGWLSIEPLITPSFFKAYNTRDNVIDEYTLTQALGSDRAASTLEQHYSAFVNFQTFVDIRNAGFDHVRIPFSYWAVTTYEGDPYVPKISWRYLLRGIEWARQNGLRVNLDVHGLPGSQNGWNHSGRQGVIGWLNGTDGDLNAQRSLEMHDQLSKFFAQDRYKNLVTMYGLANEPRMTEINTNDVLNWTTTAVDIVRKNGIDGVIVFGDGFMGLDNWQGLLQNDDKLLLDVHQYVVFNVDQLSLDHSDKLNFACKGWTAQMKRSQDRTTGFGPTMCGEWSQADTDCAAYLNNVGVGSRWEGTLNTGNASTSVLEPMCPTQNSPRCECDDANADPASYSDAYAEWLRDFAEAQMHSFEVGWGWFYWTWDTEESAQWSYKKGLAAGILPSKTWERKFDCKGSIPDFGGMGLDENY